jgi:hypothetical protein
VSSWCHCEGVEVIMNKGIAPTHNGEDNKLDKLRLGSYPINRWDVLWVVEE